MTTLKSKLQEDLTAAIKERDELRSSTLRLTLTAITKEEVAGKTARELSDDEVQKVIAREAKKRREAAEAFAQGGRAEQAERERAEGEVLADVPAQAARRTRSWTRSSAQAVEEAQGRRRRGAAGHGRRHEDREPEGGGPGRGRPGRRRGQEAARGLGLVSDPRSACEHARAAAETSVRVRGALPRERPSRPFELQRVVRRTQTAASPTAARPPNGPGAAAPACRSRRRRPPPAAVGPAAVGRPAPPSMPPPGRRCRRRRPPPGPPLPPPPLSSAAALPSGRGRPAASACPRRRRGSGRRRNGGAGSPASAPVIASRQIGPGTSPPKTLSWYTPPMVMSAI